MQMMTGQDAKPQVQTRSRTHIGRAGQGRAGQGRAGQGRAATSDRTACRSRAAAIPLEELGTHRTETDN